jgi:pilus assembly protein CpaE
MAYNKLGVEVVFGSGKIRTEILEILSAIPAITLVGHTSDTKTVSDKIRLTADLVLVELSEGVTIPDWLWNITRKISPGAIILCAPRWQPDFLIQATQVGFHSFLTMPFSRTELKAIINKIELIDDSLQPGKGKVIVVTGYKGGVGVTTVAINLAMALGQNANDKVALVDLGVPFPDVARFIDKEVSYSLYEAVEHGGNIDVTFLTKLMQPYDSNLDILNGYVDVGGTYRLDTNAFRQIISTLRRMYNFIIIDLGQSFDQLYMEVIKQSDLVIILSGLTIADLKNIKATWPMFTEWSEGAIKLKVVVNRLNKGNNIQIKSLEEIIRGPVFETLPSDYHLLMDAQFQGAPLSVTAPRAKLWHKVEALAEKVREQLGATSEELEVSAPEIPARAQTGFSWQSPRGIMLAALSLAVLLLVILMLNFLFKKKEVPDQATVKQGVTKTEKALSRPELPPQAMVNQETKDMGKVVSHSKVPHPAKMAQKINKLPKSLGADNPSPGATAAPAAPEGKPANPTTAPPPGNASGTPPASSPNLAAAVNPAAPAGQAANPAAAPAPEKSMAKEAGNAAGPPAGQTGSAAPHQEQASKPAAPAAAKAHTKPKYVGSITSNKYHYPYCKWAKTIPHKKLIAFKSAAAAKAKGYIPCPTCNPPRKD